MELLKGGDMSINCTDGDVPSGRASPFHTLVMDGSGTQRMTSETFDAFGATPDGAADDGSSVFGISVAFEPPELVATGCSAFGLHPNDPITIPKSKQARNRIV